MSKVRLLDKTFKLFIRQQEIEKSIDAVAKKINKDYNGAEDIPIILCVLNGSLIFTSELMKRLTFNCQLATIKLSSYSGTQSTGTIKLLMEMSADVKGRRVIVVEDIVDTGNTIVDLSNILKEKGAKEVKICTMLLKPEVYDKAVKLDYVAKEIPNDFIIGYGLDYNELGRNLPDIYVID